MLVDRPLWSVSQPLSLSASIITGEEKGQAVPQPPNSNLHQRSAAKITGQ
jgi:hypothetical protein